tara:strand:+ start:95 stop:862 length:768 start_codon:yes stop_codon:yes gene_type:complete
MFLKMTNRFEPWIDTRLQPEEMAFLNEAISDKENNYNWNSSLAGNISKSELILDAGNWFYESALKKLTERLFYDDWNNYRKYHIVKEEPLPKFELDSLWVNYMKQHEFNPIHNHSGLYSFVIFVKIPTHWKEQHKLSISANSNAPLASDFQFVWSKSDVMNIQNFPLSSKDEGRMLFFPASTLHLVYPFYECKEDRVTISGNIKLMKNLKKDEIKREKKIEEIVLQERMLKDFTKQVRKMQKELLVMKKEVEKEE